MQLDATDSQNSSEQHERERDSKRKKHSADAEWTPLKTSNIPWENGNLGPRPPRNVPNKQDQSEAGFRSDQRQPQAPSSERV